MDAELNGQPNATATGDGADETGISLNYHLHSRRVRYLVISVMKIAGDAAVVYAYFDWNGDGDFGDPDEKYDVAVPDGFSGNVNIAVQVPGDVLIDAPLGARITA